jgi:hypothetical protein
MLKFENIAKVGDTIRSMDFPPIAGRDDVYVEGVVVDVNDNQGYKAFVIQVTEDTLKRRVGETVYVPMEVCFMEYDGRIVNLSA